MIDRYSRAPMRRIWTEDNKFQAYLEVELLAAEAWSELGIVPNEDVALLRQKARFNVERIHEIEEITRHDVVAFTRTVSESLGDEKKWVHYGLTSTDVVDTANGYLLKQANTILREDLHKMLDVIARRANEFRLTPVIGRTHGMHADVTSFGLKWALWYAEMKRNLERFELAAKGVEAGKLSGAVGNYANIPPFIQEYVCSHLGLESAPIATQVLGRDRHAWYIATLAVIAGTLEQMALEVRNMQRQEVHEVEEAFQKGQKGSSAMPHKRNPISSENICGCARVMRGYMATASENIALWHERDISHSSTERIVLPDATMLLDYMLVRFTGILDNLVVYPEQMLHNIGLTHGAIFAQRVMNALIAKGLVREQAYDMVQPVAMKTLQEGGDMLTNLKHTPAVTALLTDEEIDSCFTLDYYMKQVDYLFNRVGINSKLKNFYQLSTINSQLMNTIDVVLGMQWGDEGKGKIVDALTPRYDVVARFQGGPNAGHSIYFGDRSFVLHTVPSGIFRQGTQNIIGNGVVIDPLILMDEIRAIEQMGVDVLSSLRIAKRAHLILPTHRLLDAAQESGKGKNKVGTTGKGIGPAYTDKASRIGLRVGDLLLPDFEERYHALRDQHLRLLGIDRVDDAAWLEAAMALRRFPIIDNEVEMNSLLASGHSVLAEGAQGSLLDVDFGTYPFVTSSSTLCAGACIGLGVAPSRIGRVYGIFKAYCTRVGAGPFPTELNDATGETLRQIGHEFGATTGRPRRTGWLDLVALRYAVMMNGTTSLIMMKSDVLNGLDTIRICVGYRMGGKQIDYFPFEAAGEPIEPVYRDFKGWQTDISSCRTYDSLPAELKDYIAFIEQQTGVPVDIVSVGPDRDATIYRTI